MRVGDRAWPGPGGAGCGPRGPGASSSAYVSRTPIRAVGAGGTRFGATTAPRAQPNGVASNADGMLPTTSGSAWREQPGPARGRPRTRGPCRGRRRTCRPSRSARAPWRRAIAAGAIARRRRSTSASRRRRRGRRRAGGPSAPAPAGSTRPAALARPQTSECRDERGGPAPATAVTIEARGRRPCGGDVAGGVHDPQRDAVAGAGAEPAGDGHAAVAGIDSSRVTRFSVRVEPRRRSRAVTVASSSRRKRTTIGAAQRSCVAGLRPGSVVSGGGVGVVPVGVVGVVGVGRSWASCRVAGVTTTVPRHRRRCRSQQYVNVHAAGTAPGVRASSARRTASRRSARPHAADDDVVRARPWCC